MNLKKIATLAVTVMLLTAAMAMFGGCNGYQVPDYADVYVTTGTMSKLLARQTSVKFTDYLDEYEFEGVSITVDTKNTYQEFYGFGASLTHSAASLLMQEGAESVADEMLNELFGADGARLNLVRIPIGASDYIDEKSFFTCCDTVQNAVDFDLVNFSISHDTNIIAVLKKILEINPDVKIFACPWSAPAWMKETKSLLSGTVGENFYGVYADYLVKFVEAYKNEGIDIDYLSLANEPLKVIGNYPCMGIDELQALQIGQLVVDRLADKNLDVALLGWDHNDGDMAYDYFDTVFKTGDTYDIFTGAAIHGYEGSVIAATEYVKSNFADKQIFMTEITEHTGSNDFASNLSYAAKNVTVDPINYGLNGAMFWNLVLRSDGTPTAVKHNEECYGVLDLDYKDGEFSYYKRSSYYAMAHVGKFAYAVDGKYPTALKVTSSNDSQILASALYRADGAIIVTAVNVSDQLSEKVFVVIDGKTVSVELMPQSVVTFVC